MKYIFIMIPILGYYLREVPSEVILQILQIIGIGIIGILIHFSYQLHKRDRQREFYVENLERRLGRR